MARTLRPDIACYICGTAFQPYSKNSLYCSDRCRRSTKSSTQRPLVTCVWCQKDFTSVSSTSKYCSPLCREQYRADQAKRHLPTKTCSCGVQFAPVNGSHRYCSVPCKLVAGRASKHRYNTSENGKQKIHAYNLEYHQHNYAPGSRQSKKENLARCYGLSIEDYEAMVEEQRGLCYICHQPPPGRYSLCVDHSHTTGKIRRLLCLRCNWLLGNCLESPEILDKAKAYLLQFNGTESPETC